MILILLSAEKRRDTVLARIGCVLRNLKSRKCVSFSDHMRFPPQRRHAWRLLLNLGWNLAAIMAGAQLSCLIRSAVSVAEEGGIPAIVTDASPLDTISPAWSCAGLSDRELIQLLARARRIDPDGQQLLRLQAFLRKTIEQIRLQNADLLSDVEVRRGMELLSQCEVRNRIKEIQLLPRAEDQEREYRFFLQKYDIDDLTMNKVAQVRFRKTVLDSKRKELQDVDKKLVEIEKNAPISLGGLRQSSDEKRDWPPKPPQPVVRPAPTEVDPLTAERLRSLLQTLMEGGQS